MTLKDYTSTISANAYKFVPGKTITEAWLISKFNVEPLPATFTARDVSAYNARKVMAYTRINKILACRGLYIKAHDYYTSFKVIEKPMDKVANYRKKAKSNAMAAVTLAAGVSNYQSKWSRLSGAETQRLSASIHTSLFPTTY